MSEAKAEKVVDPLEPWREMRDAYMNAWSKTMIEAVNSEVYAESTGTMLNTYLTATAPFKEAVEKAMTETLQQLSMPTRQDITSIAERLTNLEMRLDDMDASLLRIERLLSRPSAGPAKGGENKPAETAPSPEPSAGAGGKETE